MIRSLIKEVCVIRRRALLIGINKYHPVVGPLRGCINDAYQIKRLLLKHFSFSPKELRELYDGNATREAVLDSLAWFVSDTEAGDVLVFFYSGHGTQLPNSQDSSGKDEALVAISPEWKKLLANEDDASLLFLESNWNLQFIRDKEIKSYFDMMPDNANLTLIIDCCHSGDINRDVSTFPRYLQPPISVQNAILEAQKEYWHYGQENPLSNNPEELKLSKEHAKHWFQKIFLGNRFDYVSTQENNILLAACSEKETALEKSFNGQPGGVFTHHLIQALRKHDGLMTYNDLMQTLGQRMRSTPQMPRLTCPEQYRHQLVFSPFNGQI